MKRTTVALLVLVSLSLAFSIAAFAIVAQDHISIPSNSSPVPTTHPTITQSPENTPAPHITGTPQPTPSPTPQIGTVAIDYTESSRQNLSASWVKVVLTVNALNAESSDVSFDYSEFYLQLYVPRFLYHIPGETVAPKNSGAFTLEPSQTKTFQLTYNFPNPICNGMDEVNQIYMLQYNGTATIQWKNQDYRYAP